MPSASRTALWATSASKHRRLPFLIDEGFDAFGIAHRPLGDIRFKTSPIASQFLISHSSFLIPNF